MKWVNFVSPSPPVVDCLFCLETIRKVDWKVGRSGASREKSGLKLV